MIAGLGCCGYKGGRVDESSKLRLLMYLETWSGEHSFQNSHKTNYGSIKRAINE